MFAAEGAKVAVFELKETAGRSVAEAINRAGGEAAFFPCDVSDEDSVRSAVEAARRRFGRLDVLYNNAGIMPEEDHSVIDTSVEVWDRVMAVNVRGIFLTCKYVIPVMIEQGKGSIINIASFVAFVGCSVPQDAYTASKGAVVSLTKSLAIQFRPKGIRSNAICPGPIETPLLTEWLLRDEARKSDSAAAQRALRPAGGHRLLRHRILPPTNPTGPTAPSSPSTGESPAIIFEGAKGNSTRRDSLFRRPSWSLRFFFRHRGFCRCPGVFDGRLGTWGDFTTLGSHIFHPLGVSPSRSPFSMDGRTGWGSDRPIRGF